MRRVVCASLTLAGILAVTPFAFADSFTSTLSGLHTISTLKADSKSPTLNGETKIASNQSPHHAISPGMVAGGPTLSSEIGFPLEALLYPADNKIGSKGQPVATDDLSANGPFLMAEMSGDKDGIDFAGIKRANSAGRKSSPINEVSKGGIGLVGMIAAVAETPEPGSLFLLGTGLLGLALAVFWKSAKSSSGS